MNTDFSTPPSKRSCSIDFFLVSLGIILQRAPFIGNAHLNIDEQFYLLTGTRMLHGALPYVDIWDRKPIGLFLIYAFSGLFGSGIIAYQILALVSVVATSTLIYTTARHYADRTTAILAAITYPALLNFMQGAGGQSPIFYNFPVSVAAVASMTMIVKPWEGSEWSLLRRGTHAMLLIGLAIQIKYNAVFDGVFVGFVMILAAWRKGRYTLSLKAAALWSLAALFPTAVAFLYYYSIGYSDNFIFANFISIFNRHPFADSGASFRLAQTAKIVGTPIAFGIIGLILGHRAIDRNHLSRLYFIGSWAVADIVSYLAFPPYFMHYAMPLLIPALLIFAFSGPIWTIFRILIIAYVMIAGVEEGMEEASFETSDSNYVLVEKILRKSRNCPFIYSGPSMFYQTGGYCLPTRYPFPYHLNMVRERGALGIDTDLELARILSLRPDYILMHWPPFEDMHQNSQFILLSKLSHDYHRVLTTKDKHRSLIVYQLNEGLAPLPNAVVPAVNQHDFDRSALEF